MTSSASFSSPEKDESAGAKERDKSELEHMCVTGILRVFQLHFQFQFWFHFCHSGLSNLQLRQVQSSVLYGCALDPLPGKFPDRALSLSPSLFYPLRQGLIRGSHLVF